MILLFIEIWPKIFNISVICSNFFLWCRVSLKVFFKIKCITRVINLCNKKNWKMLSNKKNSSLFNQWNRRSTISNLSPKVNELPRVRGEKICKGRSITSLAEKLSLFQYIFLYFLKFVKGKMYKHAICIMQTWPSTVAFKEEKNSFPEVDKNCLLKLIFPFFFLPTAMRTATEWVFFFGEGMGGEKNYAQIQKKSKRHFTDVKPF